jgi:hypothetical protein
VPPDTFVFDLQFRLRCSRCTRRGGFRITIFDKRTQLERVVVAAGALMRMRLAMACAR